MRLAYRGVVDDDGDVVAWPMLLLDHQSAFNILSWLSDYRARWRQWKPGSPPDIDPGGEEYRPQIEEWLRKINAL